MRNNVFTILGIDTREINWFPETVLEEILQNVAILITTAVGSVPLDRNLGINPTFIDESARRAMMKLTIFTMETLQEYEPRVEVREIDFVNNPDDALDGRFYPRVVVRILDEYIT